MKHISTLLFLSLCVLATNGQDNVAFSAGGFSYPIDSPADEADFTPLTSIQLFGCPDGGSAIPDIPEATGNPSVVYLEEVNAVLVCGGFTFTEDYEYISTSKK